MDQRRRLYVQMNCGDGVDTIRVNRRGLYDGDICLIGGMSAVDGFVRMRSPDMTGEGCARQKGFWPVKIRKQ